MGRLGTVELLVLTNLDQLVFKLKIVFSYFTKQATLMRRSTVLSLPSQLVFRGGWQKRSSLRHPDDCCARKNIYWIGSIQDFSLKTGC